jgi:hypothetical protein
MEFVEVSVSARDASGDGVVEVVLRNGRQLRVRSGVDATTVAALARALEA